MKKLLLLVVCCFVLSGCNSYNEAEQTKDPLPKQEITPTKNIEQELVSTPLPTETPTPIPTATPEPTSAPTPTLTPTTTPTPKPTATPTPKPTSTPKPTATPKPTPTPTLQNAEPTLLYSFSGKGDDVIVDVYVESGSFVKFICEDDRYKCLKAHHGDDYELLVNESDAYTGCTFLKDCYDTNVMFEINATGEWTLEIYFLGSSTTDSFSGKGDFVTPIFAPSSKVYEIKCPADRYFCVKGYYGNFDYDLLVNESEPYSGKVLFKPYGGYAFFTIESHGEWSINPVK